MQKLAIISSHPIQYNAPFFRLLHQRGLIHPRVFYTWGEDVLREKYDPGFGRTVKWDIDLLEGYEYEFVKNIAVEPGSHHFRGIDNPDLVKRVKDWGADALLVYSWNFKAHLRLLRYFKGKIPLFFRGDSTLLDEQPGVRRLVRRLWLKWIYSHVDKAFYVGKNNKAYYLAHGLKEEQLVYAPHAIDNRRFSEIPQQAWGRVREWRKELGISESDFVILFCGKFEQKKNPFCLFQIAEVLKQGHIRFLFVGNGPLESDLKKRALGDSRFLFMDFQNQSVMPLVYRLGDVFILPSQGPGETWGLSVNEAMACSLPVIASDKVGGAIDLIKHNGNGLVFSQDDIDSVRDYISLLSQDREIWQKACKASLRHVAEFTYHTFAEAVENTCRPGKVVLR